MKDTCKGQSIVIKNSPIEFILVGPKGKHKGVIAKSDNSDLALIGVAASENYRPAFSILSWLAKVTFSIRFESYYSVRTHHLSNIDESEKDSRLSDYSLWWKGAVSSEDKDDIHKEFSRRAADIQNSVTNDDVDRFEWNLAPILLLCHKANQRGRIHRRLHCLMFIFAAILMLIVLIDALIKAKGS